MSEQLGAVCDVNGRVWIGAVLPDGSSGYVLGPNARRLRLLIDHFDSQAFTPALSHQDGI